MPTINLPSKIQDDKETKVALEIIDILGGAIQDFLYELRERGMLEHILECEEPEDRIYKLFTHFINHGFQVELTDGKMKETIH